MHNGGESAYPKEWRGSVAIYVHVCSNALSHIVHLLTVYVHIHTYSICQLHICSCLQKYLSCIRISILTCTM